MAAALVPVVVLAVVLAVVAATVRAPAFAGSGEPGGSEGPGGGSARATIEVGGPVDGGTSAPDTTITFSTFPENTPISTQYRDRGIDFGGDSPYITYDDPRYPALSGTPRWQGAIEGYFVQPDGGGAVVDHFSVEVGWIDIPGSVEVIVYDRAGSEIGREVILQDEVIATVRFSLPDIGSFRVQQVPGAPLDKFGIDNVRFPSSTAPSIPAAQTLGFGCDGCAVNPTMSHGKPVNTATGNESMVVTDAALSGAGERFDLLRAYNSLDPAVGALGKGWQHRYESRLEFGEGQTVVYVGADGQRAGFKWDSTLGTYRPDPGVLAELSTTGSGFVVEQIDHSRSRFDSAGRLVRVEDRVGVGVDLGYSGDQLTTVTDAAGRVVTFSYVGDRLRRVELPDGRFVGYGYTGGLLSSVQDLRGFTTGYGYDGAERLDTITDPNGRVVLDNDYDPGTGRVTRQVGPTGAVTTFGWDPATGTSTTTMPGGGQWVERYHGNVLVRSIDPLGNTTFYGYDDDANLTALVDPRGQATSMSYDGRGRMLSRTSPAPGSYRESWTYRPDGNPLTYTDRRGNTTSFDYFPSGLLQTVTHPTTPATTTEYTYTAQGQVATVRSPRGKTTGYDYDPEGNLVRVTSPSGNATMFGHDPSGRVSWVRDPRGNTTGAASDPVLQERYTTHFGYDDADQLVSLTDARDGVTGYDHDQVGDLVETTLTGPGGELVSRSVRSYDAAHRVLSVANRRVVEASYGYDGRGNLTSLTDAAGATTRFGYDDADRLTSMVTARGTEPGAAAADYTWTYRYDEAGNQVQRVDPKDRVWQTGYDELNRPVSTTTPMGRTTEYGYDPNGNLTSTTRPRTGSTTVTTGYGYDPMDRLVEVTEPGLAPARYGYDADGNLTSHTSPSGTRLTTWTYDDDGRLATRVDPRGHADGRDPVLFTTSYAYDPAGNLDAVTDQLGAVWDYEHNPTNQLVAADDPRAGPPTRYGYDPAGRLRQVTGPDGGQTVYAYDEVGDLVQRTDANGHHTGYTYTDRHQLATRTGPRGMVDGATQATRDRFTTSYDYDPEGNLVQTITARGRATGDLAAWTITQTFNERGLRTGIATADAASSATSTYNNDGQLTAVDDTTGTTNLSWYPDGLLRKVSQPDGDYNYHYTDSGQVASRTYPDGSVIDYTHDADNFVASMTADGDTYTFDHNADGQLYKTTYPGGNGMVETRAHDRTGLPSWIQTKRTGATEPLSRYDYTRDPAGNPTLIERTRGTTAHPEALAYDDANRLAKSCPGVTSCAGAADYIAYDHDQVGNRLTQTRVGVPDPGSTTYTYNPADQLTSRVVTGGETTDYHYDADGNLLNGRSWDPLNRMTARTAGGVTTTFGYDGFDLRRTATTGTGTRTTSWDLNNPLPMIATLTRANGTSFSQRYNPDGWPLANTISGAAHDRAYFHHDGMGSITDITTATGTPAWRYGYEPFGEHTETTKLIPDMPDPDRGYTGEFYDARARALHLRARDYDPALGRFTSTDPISPPLTNPYVSSYAYVANRPTLYTDPSGQCPICIGVWLLAAGATGGAVGGVTYVATNDGEFDRSEYLQHVGTGGLIGLASAGGAVAGGAAATAIGLGSVGALGGAAAGSAAGTVAGHYTADTAFGDPYTSDEVKADLLFGGLGGAIGQAARACTTALRGAASGAAKTGASSADDVLRYGSTPAGRPFTRHYGTETGPQRNIPGSVVDEAIDFYPGKLVGGGKTVHYDPVNNITVVTGDGGAIVSVHKGLPRAGQR